VTTQASGDVAQVRATLQETMSFLGALAAGTEQLVGRPANAMAFMAGKSLGKRFSANAQKTNDIETALGEVRRVLEENHCLWEFEPFQPKAQKELITVGESGDRDMMLTFRECMIRQSLFRYGHVQKGSLCYMMYGFFSGALETIMGRKTDLEILHAGQNACLKRLRIHAK
jgi:predicted hydrocarbon binding protein